MPANLTPQYLEAEKKFKIAKTNQEKILALEEMFALIPKHKGTEKMQADIKKRISKLKDQSKKLKGGARTQNYYIEREGASQVVLIGYPNSGKSSLLANLTNAEPQIAPYPYTTTKAHPGMMDFENIQFQLVDTPAISKEFTESWLLGIIRLADAALLIIDLINEPLEQIEFILEKLNNFKISLIGKFKEKKEEFNRAYIKALILGNKIDESNAQENFIILKELYDDKFKIIPISTFKKTNLELLRQEIFNLLEIIRVYTKVPGKNPDLNKPYVLKKGSKVIDMACVIHKEFAEKLKYARIWGSGKYAGGMVQKDYILHDQDVIEIHLR
ncbi:MAG: 50S ribosome-binding GTPase [Armatimonadetes bacterium]|nr:50S ribosome-binding GTPase [Armatimonadota bacterium]